MPSKRFHSISRRISEVCKQLWKNWVIISSVPHTWHTIWRLIWPLTWNQRLPTLLDPLEIHENPAIVHQRYYVDDNYRLLRAWPIFQFRDTPLRSLYRLHDVLCADEANYVMLESDGSVRTARSHVYSRLDSSVRRYMIIIASTTIPFVSQSAVSSDYFWRRENWHIKDIPDPKDPNPIQYAILASLVEEMADAQNRKISLGLCRGVRVGSKTQDIAFRLDTNKPYEEVPPWALAVPPLVESVSFLKNAQFSAKPSYAFKRRNISANSMQLWNI